VPRTDDPTEPHTRNPGNEALTSAPATARTLLTRALPFGPAVEGEELVFATDPPDELIPTLAVLHTGIRAIIAGRRWWATTCIPPVGTDRFSRVGVAALDPSALLPSATALLCVEGDSRWDRIHPAARFDLPHLFAAEKPARRKRLLTWRAAAPVVTLNPPLAGARRDVT